jgi:hypothetical protein
MKRGLLTTIFIYNRIFSHILFYLLTIYNFTPNKNITAVNNSQYFSFVKARYSIYIKS